MRIKLKCTSEARRNTYLLRHLVIEPQIYDNARPEGDLRRILHTLYLGPLPPPLPLVPKRIRFGGPPLLGAFFLLHLVSGTTLGLGGSESLGFKDLFARILR